MTTALDNLVALGTCDHGGLQQSQLLIERETMSSLKMKKFVSIKGVIDNLRQSVNTPAPPTGGGGAGGAPVKLEQDIIENLVADQFTAEPTLRHGFPFKPLSMAFDPVQKILAIGNRQGAVRIYGKPGIDVEFTHENPCQVMQIVFLVNAGKLITACTDDTVNLWNFSKKVPELMNTCKLAKERLTRIHLEFQVWQHSRFFKTSLQDGNGKVPFLVCAIVKERNSNSIMFVKR